MTMIRYIPILCFALLGCSESRTPKTASESPPVEEIVPIAQAKPSRAGGLLDPSWQGSQHESGKTELGLTFQPGKYWIKFRTAQEPSEGPIFDGAISLDYRIEFNTRAGETLTFFEETLEGLPDTGAWMWVPRDMPALGAGYVEVVLTATVFVEEVSGVPPIRHRAPQEKTGRMEHLRFQSDGSFTTLSLGEFENGHDYGACGWDSSQRRAWCGGMGESPAGELSSRCPLEVTEGSPCDGQFHTCCAPGGALWVCESWGVYVLAYQCGGVARCGDGRVEFEEVCDDGDDDDNDLCANDCTLICGNGVVNGTEECDDGNDSNTDACTNSCLDARCGDGFVQPGEACDPGAPGRVLCSDNCRLQQTLP